MSKTIPKSVAELRAILADPDQLIGVRQAAERRLRKLSAESAPPPVAASRQSAADSTPCTVCAGTGRTADDDLSPCPHCNPSNR